MQFSVGLCQTVNRILRIWVRLSFFWGGWGNVFPPMSSSNCSGGATSNKRRHISATRTSSGRLYSFLTVGARKVARANEETDRQREYHAKSKSGRLSGRAIFKENAIFLFFVSMVCRIPSGKAPAWVFLGLRHTEVSKQIMRQFPCQEAAWQFLETLPATTVPTTRRTISAHCLGPWCET